MSKPGFEQTHDLVRFHIRGPRAAVVELMEHALAVATRRGRWISEASGPSEDDPGRSWCFFYCGKEEAPAVLDILAKHGIERVREFGS